MKVTTRRFSTHIIEHEGKELALSFEPCNTSEIKILEDGNIRVGYLTVDDNPLDFDDIGMQGKFHSLGRRHSNRIDIANARKLLKSSCNVPLSYFEHGRCSWTVMGNKPLGTEGDWRWDGVDFAGVWEADEYSKKEWKRLNKEDRLKAAYERASQQCETYTYWCNGDIYGVCVDEFDKEGELVKDDACWGHIGSEWAEHALKEEMK